jgi:hypothetical protein
MRRLFAMWVGLATVLLPALSFAEGAGGTYRGIGQMYYTFIWIVLTYGVYDTFGKKAMYVAAPIMAVGLYLLLPAG